MGLPADPLPAGEGQRGAARHCRDNAEEERRHIAELSGLARPGRVARPHTSRPRGLACHCLFTSRACRGAPTGRHDLGRQPAPALILAPPRPQLQLRLRLRLRQRLQLRPRPRLRLLLQVELSPSPAQSSKVASRAVRGVRRTRTPRALHTRGQPLSSPRAPPLGWRFWLTKSISHVAGKSGAPFSYDVDAPLLLLRQLPKLPAHTDRRRVH